MPFFPILYRAGALAFKAKTYLRPIIPFVAPLVPPIIGVVTLGYNGVQYTGSNNLLTVGLNVTGVLVECCTKTPISVKLAVRCTGLASAIAYNVIAPSPKAFNALLLLASDIYPYC